MKRIGVSSVVILLGLLVGLFLWNSGRESAGESPDDWRQLSLADFVQTIDQLLSGDEPVSADLMAEIRGQSAERLSNAMDGNTTADYGDLVALYAWARPTLTAEEDAAALAALTPDANQVSVWTYEKMRAVQDRMNRAGMPIDSNHQLTLAWLKDRDVSTIENPDDVGWLFCQVQLMGRDDPGPQKFSVTWTGSVQIPTTGDYTFSVCPLDLNFRVGNTFREQTNAIWLDGQQILASTKTKFVSESDAVSLTAGAKVPIRVELTMDCSHQGTIDARPAVAMLTWKGPGMQKRLIPTAVLFPPDGSAASHGLLRKFTFEDGGETKTVTQTDPQVNFVWYDQELVASQYETLRARLAERLFALVTNPSTLESWESNPAATRVRWEGHWGLLESLSLERQGQWAQALVAHPALLVDCSAQDVDNIYSRCRIGAPEDAVNLLGKWALGHSDESPSLAIDFYHANREVYRRLAQNIVWNASGHFETLEQDYLENSDGECVLPVAYTLSYGYWMQKRILEWIEQLDARLANEQLTGDRRVNWLLARAQAQEIRRSPANRHWTTLERALAGRHWIEEATLVAKSEAARLRAYQELATRLTVRERIDAAGKVLDAAAQRCSSPESTAALAQWRGELDALRAAFAAKHADHETLIQSTRVAHLQARHQRALARGDSEAASRYEDLLAAAAEE